MLGRAMQVPGRHVLVAVAAAVRAGFGETAIEQHLYAVVATTYVELA